MDSEPTNRKSRKIRVYPDFTQRAKLREWFGCARYVYNKTVAYLRTRGTKANWKAIKGGIMADLPEWASATPYQIKSQAVRDACRAVMAAKKKYVKTRRFSKVGFRKKHGKQTLYIQKAALLTQGPYYTLLGPMKTAEPLPKIVADCRLSYRQGQWFLSIPIDATPVRAESQGRTVAIDPGIRSFVTWYTHDGCGKIGQGDYSRILRLGAHLDDLISRIKKEKHRNKRYRMRRAADRMRWKVRNLIDELHHKAALFLVQNFDIILLPKFETGKMSCKAKRKLRSKTVRAMMTLAHYRFGQFLRHKAVEYGKTVLEANEAYTSKTVSWTGAIKEIGGAKFIRDGGIVVDRDYNGARGIYLRALCEISPPPASIADGAQQAS